jgi:hypothetical protein
VPPGFLSDGPLVLSGAPFTPVASCEGDMPFSPELAPLLPFASIAGPLLPPGSPFTPGPELVDELGILLLFELSAANAGTTPIEATTAQAVRSFFMAFPSLFVFAYGRNTRQRMQPFRD